MGTLRNTAVVADEIGICPAIENARFQAHSTSVPRSVPAQCWRSAYIKFRNLLSIMGLQDTRRFFKPAYCDFAITEKILEIRKCLRAVYLEVRW